MKKTNTITLRTKSGRDYRNFQKPETKGGEKQIKANMDAMAQAQYEASQLL